ncbi:MAG TPA: metal ABC transporter permease [Firmicutes bacterium]|nr:metal ABC transporter permease [Bacillota bacterium]
MGEFLRALWQYPFLQNAVLAGVLSSLACGVTGVYVVVKRITFISGGIAHAVLGGIGVAYYLGKDPLSGAVIAALLSAFLLGMINLTARQHEDTIIGALWAVGMATGIIFITLTPGYSVDLMSFLFGNILMVTAPVLWVLFSLDLIILLLVVVFYRQFLLVCYDEEYARLRGLPVRFLYILLLALIALTVVVLIKVVGLIMVIALLTLPAAVASLFTYDLSRMMVSATGLGLIFIWVGLVISYNLNLPSGATIVIIAGLCYLGALGLRKLTHQVGRRQKAAVLTAKVTADEEES